MKIAADLEVCTGHARCQALAPAVYATDDIEGKVVVLCANAPPEHEREALRGARACPERAIFITGDGGEPLWPPLR